MKVAKWGNSLAVRIPADVVQLLGLKEGDEITITASSRNAVIDKKPSPEELLERIRKHRGAMPADWKFDREEANERG